MSSAEANLQLRTQVGNFSPTMLQTLLNLLNLYNSANTDREDWVSNLESHPAVLTTLLAAAPPTSLVDWHASYSHDDLRHMAFAAINQLGTSNLYRPDTIDTALLNAVTLLTTSVEPAVTRKAELTCRLIGTSFASTEEDVREASIHYSRPLNELHGTSLLTRLIAVSYHCIQSHPYNLRDCTSLLSLDNDNLGEVLQKISNQPKKQVRSEILPNIEARFLEALALANLRNSAISLTQSTNQNLALRELTAALFDTFSLTLFLQQETGWSDGVKLITSPYSIVLSAVDSGRPVSTLSRQLTVIDEQILHSIDAAQGIALPILMETGRPESCAAVAIIGLSKSRMMELAGNTELIEKYSTIARSIFGVVSVDTLSVEDVDSRAREIIHEANNPISTVQNYLKVLSLQLGEEHDAQDTLETISAELFRAAEIIKSFRDIRATSRGELGQCRVNKCLQEICSLYEKVNEDIHFEYLLDELDPVANIGTDDFKQVVTNLIKNATEAVAPGDTISLCTTANLVQGAQVFVEIIVKDTGPGIAQHLANIFDKGVTTKTGEHAGEGLAVIQQLTDRAGGLVSYRTGPGGTEFRLTIPQI